MSSKDAADDDNKKKIESSVISKRIQIQSLETKTKNSTSQRMPYEHAGIYWRSKVCQDFKTCPQCHVLTYDQSCDATMHVVNEHNKNALFEAFMQAYENHKGIILSPDYIWIQVLFQFSAYVCKHQEKLSHHNFGKGQITTDTANTDVILAQVTKTNANLLFQNNFTTTQNIHKFISAMSMMAADPSSHERKSDPHRQIKDKNGGGITQVEFLGTLQDWADLYHRVNRLASYDVNGTWSNYITGVTFIISKWYLNYQGTIDINWWNEMPKWVLDLFGPYEEIPTYRDDLSVLISINGRNTTLKAGFSGIEYINGFYRPQLSFALIDVCSRKG